MTDSNTPPVRVWLFGKFLVKLRNNNGTEEEVRNAAWATTYARPLLKRLVPATGRRASRSTLLTDLFPQKSDDEIGKEEESQEKRKNKYLSDAATKLRQILGHEIINPLGSHGAGGYELAGPAFLWSDVEECGLLVKEAEGLPLVEALSRLEKASEYFKRGELLEGEDGQWCHAFRRSQEKAMRQCHIMLAKNYEARNQPWNAIKQYERLLEIDPFDEDALCLFLAMLHRHAIIKELRSVYEEAQRRFHQEEMPLSKTTKRLFEKLMQEPPLLAVYLTPPSTPVSVDTNCQKEDTSPLSNAPSEDIIIEGGPMKKDRRNLTAALVGIPLGISGVENQALITEVQRVLHQPSLGPSDKELTSLEQKIMLYWHARNNVILAPADLILHVDEYVQDVKALLDRSLLPSVRTRLCACLSQGMLLIGHSLDGMKRFQTARRYYHTAVEAAHEANQNILQALAWYRNSRSWSYGNETDRYDQARESMRKACDFASLGSDSAVQCVTQLGLAEVYAYLKEKEACLNALKSADRLDGYGSGDWYFIHLFDSASLNGYRGACLQQFDQSDLLEEARRALEEALSQPNIGVLRRAFCAADMAQVYAREGRVESACDSAKQVMSMADTNASLRQSLLAIRTHLKPYNDVQEVKELDMHMRALLLPKQ